MLPQVKYTYIFYISLRPQHQRQLFRKIMFNFLATLGINTNEKRICGFYRPLTNSLWLPKPFDNAQMLVIEGAVFAADEALLID